MRRRKNRGKVVTEVRPSRAVNPGKELCFHCSTKGSHWKALTRGTEPIYLLKRRDYGLKMKAELN